ncbi:13281_t:CDS:2 [Acaulospora colombiana]|uniref:13281_t:CDS:1 n=1 Tax=Acaulospora colombiana TaxID=27376 RepID=A0ACA9LJC8_9GLOM|nr:13281_t:CDS:2 [Acaulospora colombiana]
MRSPMGLLIICCAVKGAWVCERAVSCYLRDIYTRIYRPVQSRITVVVKLEQGSTCRLQGWARREAQQWGEGGGGDRGLDIYHHTNFYHSDKNKMQRPLQQRTRDNFQTDALRPAALPSATLLRPRAAEESTIEQTSEEYLETMYEEWNKKVDVELETLVDGMAELVNIASIGNKDKFRIAQEAFETQCRTESMLLLLLSDEEEIAKRRDLAAEGFKQRAETSMQDAAEALDILLNGSSKANATDMETEAVFTDIPAHKWTEATPPSSCSTFFPSTLLVTQDTALVGLCSWEPQN